MELDWYKMSYAQHANVSCSIKVDQQDQMWAPYWDQQSSTKIISSQLPENVSV